MMKLGIISDTHNLIRPEVRDALSGCDFILHGGDISKQEILDELAEIAPEFSCLYLNGDLSPEEVEKAGLNGVAYSKKIFREHPEWVKDFIARGIKTDVWVINDPEEAKEFIEMGLEQIETDQPLMLRAVLGDREQKAE